MSNHEIALQTGIGKQKIYGWEVKRGKTKVTLKSGVTGVIMEWYGGYFMLDNGMQAHRSDIKEVHVDHGSEPSDDVEQYAPENTMLPERNE